MNDVRKELDHYRTHPNQYVSKVANHVLSLVNHLNNGSISKDEFDELSRDVLDTVHIAKHTSDIDTKARMEEGIRAIAALLPKLVGLVK